MTNDTGPWSVDQTEGSGGWHVRNANGGPVDYWTEPNARLIAAAPDLLDALQEVVLSFISEDAHASSDHLFYDCNDCGARAQDDWLAIEHDDDCTLYKPAAAIAKATLAPSPEA